MVIEQAQILTTHNLAVLAGLGVHPDSGWADLARRAHAATALMIERLSGAGHVRPAAFAWRQTLFYLSLCSAAEQRDPLAWMGERAQDAPEHARRRLDPLLTGLRQAVDGAPSSESAAVPRFQGWSTVRHWMLDIGSPATGRGQIPNGGA